jgi:GDP-4-dehydro-6-deoxy-D-mannose reductase
VKRVLVTGSGGFVGRALTRALDADGFDVWGVDRDRDPDDRSGRILAGDLCDGEVVKSVLERVRPAYVVHLAAQSSAGRSFEDPAFTIRNNLLPALHLLEHLRAIGGDGTRVLAVGSAEVYGPVGPGDLPLGEDRIPRPVSPYALGKLFQEQSCAHFASLYGSDVVMTRSFNHTGAGQRDTFVLSSFARQMIEIKNGLRPPQVHVGNIDVSRDFLDVRDVCRAYTLLLAKGRRGTVYNVCSGVAHSLRVLLGTLATMAGVDVEIRSDPDRVRRTDIPELCGDNWRIAADTGWAPSIPIEETLRGLLDYWSAQPATPGAGRE